MKKILGVIFLFCAAACFGQVSVILAPIPIFQSFLQNGQPNAFGCVFSYASQTTSAIPTWTDFSGNTLNANPVVLTAGGTANIWIQAGVSYALVIKSSGGVNCASGSTVATVNGIGGGSSTQTTNVTWSSTPTFIVTAQNQLFTITLTGNTAALPLSVVGITPPAYITFQITQDGTGGRTFAWPSNVIGGCVIGANANQVTTQQFVWNGTNATALGPCVTGNGPAISTGAQTIVGNVNVTGNVVASGIVNPTTGFEVNSLAPSNHFLVGNGTNYVDSASIPVGALTGGSLGQSVISNGANAIFSNSNGTAQVAAVTPLTGAGVAGAAHCGTATFCRDNGGLLILTTTTAATGGLIEVDFGTSHPIMNCTLSPADQTTSALSGATQVHITVGVPASYSFFISSGSSALANSTSYEWYYTCTFGAF